MYSADVTCMEVCDMDDLVDTIMGNCVYLKALYAYNKIDMLSLPEVDELAREPNHLVICSRLGWNMDILKKLMWDSLGLCRVYTKRKGEYPDLADPIIMTPARGGVKVENAIAQLHKSLLDDAKTALVWGHSVKHQPQQTSLKHEMADEDVLQIVKRPDAAKVTHN